MYRLYKAYMDRLKTASAHSRVCTNLLDVWALPSKLKYLGIMVIFFDMHVG